MPRTKVSKRQNGYVLVPFEDSRGRLRKRKILILTPTEYKRALKRVKKFTGRR